MVRRMAARDDCRHARYDLGVAFKRLDQTAHRLEAIGDMAIRGAQTFVARMPRDFDFAALDENARSRKSGLQGSRFAPLHDSTAMIEMQMRQDYVGDVAGLHPKRLQSTEKPAVAVVENLALDRAQPIADSGIDDDRILASDYQRTGQVEANPVLIVCWMLTLPQSRGTTPNMHPPSLRQIPSLKNAIVKSPT